MNTTQHLYGDLDPIILDTQATIAEAKIKACNKLLEKLLSVPMEARDMDRVKDVVKARNFNEELLKEVGKR